MVSEMSDKDQKWGFGDAVWYDPEGLGILFSGVIFREPHILGGTEFVGVGDLPKEYKPYSNNQSATVTTALVKNVYPRRNGDRRASIHWDEYQQDLSSRIGHAAKQEDPGS